MPEAVSTEDSYVSDSPYSQAIIHNDTVYVAGQVPKNTDGDIVGDTIQPQTEQVMDNIETILDAAGTSMQNITKATRHQHE